MFCRAKINQCVVEQLLQLLLLKLLRACQNACYHPCVRPRLGIRNEQPVGGNGCKHINVMVRYRLPFRGLGSIISDAHAEFCKAHRAVEHQSLVDDDRCRRRKAASGIHDVDVRVWYKDLPPLSGDIAGADQGGVGARGQLRLVFLRLPRSDDIPEVNSQAYGLCPGALCFCA